MYCVLEIEGEQIVFLYFYFFIYYYYSYNFFYFFVYFTLTASEDSNPDVGVVTSSDESIPDEIPAHAVSSPVDERGHTGRLADDFGDVDSIRGKQKKLNK